MMLGLGRSLPVLGRVMRSDGKVACIYSWVFYVYSFKTGAWLGNYESITE
jgi:hypothetical protein